MEKLKIHLQKKPYSPKFDEIKIYSELEDLKKIVTQISNYAFVNQSFLCDAMNFPLQNLENKQFKFSKNGNNLCFMSSAGNYSFLIQTIKENINEVSKFKNLYYIEDLTKKIFILLFFNEKIIQYKMKKKIKDIHNFKKYYLINDEWIREYKEFFSYDFVIKKFKEAYNNYKDELSEENLDSEDNNFITSYKTTILNFNEIIKDMGQINLYSNTEVSNYLRNAECLFPAFDDIEIKTKEIPKNEGYIEQETEPESLFEYKKIPSDFYLIDENILDLLRMEEFLINYEDKLKNCMETQVLLGNGNIIIRNFHRNIKKFNKKVDISYLHLNEYLIYADKNDKIKYLADKKDDLGNEPFILYYILYYNTNKPFFNDLRILNKKNGLKEYITKYKIELVNSKLKENLNDVRGNYIGFFYDIRINKDYINIEDNENNEKNEKENFVNIIKNINDYDNKKNKHSYDIINEINFDYIHHKSLSQNNDIKISNDFNNNIECIKNGNIIINEKNTEDVVQFIIFPLYSK
jgi:hypothetical protein